MSVLVIVPTRKRPEQVKRFIESFEATTDNAELLFVTDGDDESYKEFDWHGFGNAVLTPRGSVVEKLNFAAKEMADSYDHLMHLGDDCVFVTEHWDTLLVNALDNAGGSGWVYPDNKRRHDVPECWLVSTDIVKSTGWFLNPIFKHYYVDNCTADIGRRTSLLHYVPEVVIEHRHYSVCQETEHDEVYSEPEQLYGARDLQAYQAWANSHEVAALVSKLRREFNPDVKWVLSKI